MIVSLPSCFVHCHVTDSRSLRLTASGLVLDARRSDVRHHMLCSSHDMWLLLLSSRALLLRCVSHTHFFQA